MKSEQFVHLHLHSEYSLSDGIIRVEDLVNYSYENNFPAIALTDFSNLFGLIKFYRLARQKGIKPIVGCELNLTKEESNMGAPLILIVKNKEGYTNLTNIVSKSYIEGLQDGIPSVKVNWLREYSEGLIALSGGQKGHIGQALLSRDLKLAKKRLNFFKEVFGDDFYIEVQRVGRPDEEEYNQSAIKLAREEDICLVATNDVRFLSPIDPDDEMPSDFEAHEARVCIQKGEVLADSSRAKEYSESQYLASSEEMRNKFSDIPEALENTFLISKKCNLELELGEFYLPDFEVPGKKTTKDYLIEKATEGLKRRLKEITNSVNSYSINEDDYKKRLDYELNMICKLSFEGYFLIVADFVNWAKENDIPVGPGRGSGAGSITAYALGITAIDPLKYDLLFERFLNPDRVSNPDFDIDFCMEGRDRVLEYVTEKYGKDSVAQISTRGTMAARAVLRDVVRVLGKPYGFGDKLAKAIPDVLGISLDEAYKEKEFKELIESSEESKEVFDMSLKLEGLSRSVGTHAAGVVIAPTALTDFTPLIVDKDKGTVATQFDMGDVESAGLVKFDFLGLKTLTVINWTLKRINEKNEVILDINDLPLNDKKTFELLQRGDTTGVFQLESRGMKEYLKQLEPNEFEDIVSMNALYRPGALGMNMVDSYIDRKHGREDVTYGHDSVKNILHRTHGVIVYQEQVMQIAQDLSGFTLGQADILRRAMGKKKKDEMEKMRKDFIEGAVEKEVNRSYAENLFDQIEQFAGYGFNRSHSVGYALIAYQTAWLKAHYPSEFMSSLLSSELDTTDRIQMYVDDCRSMGLTVKKPDINSSSYLFVNLDSKTILYGLGAIKGVGESLVNSIVLARENKLFESFYDFCLRIGSSRLNKRILTTLIGSGAMDSLGTRNVLYNMIEPTLKKVEQSLERSESKIKDFFEEEKENLEIIDNNFEENTFDELANEWSALGFYLESKPLENKTEEVRKMCGFLISELEEASHKQRVAGTLVHLNVRQGRHGRYAFATIDDSSGRLEVSIWSEAFDNYRNALRKGQIVVVEGLVEKDNYVSEKDNKTYKMVADRIFSFDQARNEFIRHIKLKLNDKFEDINILTSKLKEMSSPIEGLPVVISFSGKDADADIKLPKNISILLNDKSYRDLEEICGNENVDLVYHPLPYLH
ncbi:MAG: DNA polymerase III subunit alpha [Gammaproteobacteria bacterium]|nr:MAG: DNA polymerase III subunit alpha [Gammaproteobacteria bacterium]